MEGIGSGAGRRSRSYCCDDALSAELVGGSTQAAANGSAQAYKFGGEPEEGRRILDCKARQCGVTNRNAPSANRWRKGTCELRRTFCFWHAHGRSVWNLQRIPAGCKAWER